MAYTFEDKIDIINREIAKRRGKWQLKALKEMDFDDVSQLVRLQIYNKWHLWDQSRPFENWVNRVITYRIINIVRDNYGHVAPPCNGCNFDEGENRCGYTKSNTKCDECDLYANWCKKKKTAYNLKLAGSLDCPEYIEGKNDLHSDDGALDYERSANKLHEKMKEVLTDYQWAIYDLLYIQGRSEIEVAELMGYKTSEKNRSPGYKQLHNIKKKIRAHAKKIVETEDITNV